MVSAGVGGTLIGAMLLGAATSSAHNEVTPVAAHESVDVAEVAVAAPVELLGFAPPTARTATVAPQFRLAADLPSGPLGIPGVVLQAYKLAATRVSAETPACKLPWYLLAGIGRIESNHANNGSVDEFGTTINPISGPVLDGTLAGNQVIRDSDRGRLDGDTTHDRAMGPMQFIPSTWAAWGTDANGDGRADPNNVFDATTSAGRYLCAGVTDIMSADHRVAAVMRYNHSVDYARNVLAWAAAYATGVRPTHPIPELRRPRSSTSSSPSRPSTRPSSAAPSRSTSSRPTQQCLGVVCLPPGILLPGAPTTVPSSSAPRPRSTHRTTPVR
ncbi:MAG: lytic murein transglycosylase [Gordonia sp. (in: high G+C Gram-positive bacteria)]